MENNEYFKFFNFVSLRFRKSFSLSKKLKKGQHKTLSKSEKIYNSSRERHLDTIRSSNQDHQLVPHNQLIAQFHPLVSYQCCQRLLSNLVYRTLVQVPPSGYSYRSILILESFSRNLDAACLSTNYPHLE